MLGEVYKGTGFESLKTGAISSWLSLPVCGQRCEPSASALAISPLAGCHASASAVTVTYSDPSEALSPNDPFSLRVAVSWRFITVTDVTYMEAFGCIEWSALQMNTAITDRCVKAGKDEREWNSGSCPVI